MSKPAERRRGRPEPETGGDLWDLEEPLRKRIRVPYVVNDPKTCRAPEYKSDGAAGMDLFARRVVVRGTELPSVGIPPHSVMKFSTGVHVAIPEGYYGHICGRSSLAARGIDVLGGIIDSDYRGDVVVVLENTNRESATVDLNLAIAQMLVLPCPKVYLEPCDSVETFMEAHPSTRGTGGFGSTDSPSDGSPPDAGPEMDAVAEKRSTPCLISGRFEPVTLESRDPDPPTENRTFGVLTVVLDRYVDPAGEEGCVLFGPSGDKRVGAIASDALGTLGVRDLWEVRRYTVGSFRKNWAVENVFVLTSVPETPLGDEERVKALRSRLKFKVDRVTHTCDGCGMTDRVCARCGRCGDWVCEGCDTSCAECGTVVCASKCSSRLGGCVKCDGCLEVDTCVQFLGGNGSEQGNP